MGMAPAFVKKAGSEGERLSTGSPGAYCGERTQEQEDSL